MTDILRILYEASPFGPFWSAYLVGYIVVGVDGQIYITDEGSDYLERVDA